MAMLIRRTLTRQSAPILSSFSRIEAQAAVDYSAGKVKRKAAKVLGAHLAGPVVEALEKAEIELARCGNHLRWLIGVQALDVQTVPPMGSYSDTAFPRRARVANGRLDQPPAQWRDILQALHDASDGTQAWDALFAALQNDPDAVIPGE